MRKSYIFHTLGNEKIRSGKKTSSFLVTNSMFYSPRLKQYFLQGGNCEVIIKNNDAIYKEITSSVD